MTSTTLRSADGRGISFCARDGLLIVSHGPVRLFRLSRDEAMVLADFITGPSGRWNSDESDRVMYRCSDQDQAELLRSSIIAKEEAGMLPPMAAEDKIDREDIRLSIGRIRRALDRMERSLVYGS